MLFIYLCSFVIILFLLRNDQMNLISAEKYEKKILELNNDKKEQKKQIENLQITVEAAARLENEYDKVEEDNKELKKDVVVSITKTNYLFWNPSNPVLQYNIVVNKKNKGMAWHFFSVISGFKWSIKVIEDGIRKEAGCEPWRDSCTSQQKLPTEVSGRRIATRLWKTKGNSRKWAW